MSDTQHAQARPSICVCVLLNHPFPDNLPKIRRLYEGRFSKVVFLIPFHRSADADVITVYRGSYVHAGYVTDALHRLQAIDCDHFLFIHDDVVLNPYFDEINLREIIPLGLDDGFFPAIGPVPATMGAWSWYYGFVARMLFPKSLLFGTGLEASTLSRYLPDADLVRRKLSEVRAPVCPGAWINTDGFDPVRGLASRVLFSGLSGHLAPDPEHRRVIEEKSVAVLEQMTGVMADVVSAGRGRGPDQSYGEWVDFPIPVVTGGFLADCYIVPKSRLEDYAHYIGVASAANLLTEMMAPTVLHAVCDKVLSAADCGLDLNGFHQNSDLNLLYDRHVMAIHPVKLSALAHPGAEERFFRLIASIRRGSPDRAEAELGVQGFGIGGTYHNYASQGWYPPEGWGRWTASAEAKMEFWVPADLTISRLRVRLVLPLHPKIATFSTRLRLNNGPEVSVSKAYGEDPGADVYFGVDQLITDGFNSVEIHTDLMRPSEVEPGNQDPRPIGAGVAELEFS